MSLNIRPLTGDGSPPVEGSYPQAVEVIVTGIDDRRHDRDLS